MVLNLHQSLTAEVTHLLEAFQAALAQDPHADLTRFLPDARHPSYLRALAELIRVDLAHAWSQNQPRPLESYRDQFPAVFEHPGLLGLIGFEEYVQRRSTGEAVSPQEYRDVYAIDVQDWPEIPPAPSDGPHRRRSPLPTDPPTAIVGGLSQIAQQFQTSSIASEEGSDSDLEHRALASEPSLRAGADGERPDSKDAVRLLQTDRVFPEPGTDFLGFHLVEELGRGAFGRVYLAHQGSLAGRPVALKIAYDVAGESRTLAQLQHTNIVPIYSFHKAGPFQAVCMPYFGRTTLDQVVQHVSGRPRLPSSGKELRSTLNLHRSTVRTPSRASSHSRGVIEPATTSPVPHPPQNPVSEPTVRLAAIDGWSRLQALPYVEAVTSLGGQLADGLAHAHACGILHRDLKPANVLLTDDGRAMLLDFNLAEDVKLRESADRAAIGGTLPYMAPEQMEAFRDSTGVLDCRCDVYSLGVILFELLTGRHPFPLHPDTVWNRNLLPRLIADRQQPPPSLRQWNPEISPGVEAIIHKCLAPKPADRYQCAEHLREDLDRHLANQPLLRAREGSIRERTRKWVRRHPRLTSSGTVVVVAALLLVGVGTAVAYSWDRSKDLQARGRFADHQTAFADVRVFLDDRNQSWNHLDDGIIKLRSILDRYGVAGDGTDESWLKSDAIRRLPEATRQRIREDVGEAFYRLAQVAYLKAFATNGPDERTAMVERAERWNAAAVKYADGRIPRAIREQRAALADLRGDPVEAGRLRAEADNTPSESARDAFLRGSRLAQKGEHAAALAPLGRATQLDPRDFSAWFVRGTAHLALAQNDLAAMCFGSCVALRPDFAPAWMNRAMALARLRQFAQAREDYDRAIQLDPRVTEAQIQRAAVRDATGDAKGAEEDYSRALATGEAPVRIHFLRSAVRARLGDNAGAEKDRETGLKLTPADELSWVARAEARVQDNPKGALADVEEALKLNPLSIPALQFKAHVLGERLNRPAEALLVLDRAVEFFPDHVPTRAGRAVQLARNGRRAEAIRDAREALLRNVAPANLYQVGCVYALTSGKEPDDRPEARRLLWAALKTGYGLDFVDSDTDLDSIRNDPEFKRLLAEARSLNAARNR